MLKLKPSEVLAYSTSPEDQQALASRRRAGRPLKGAIRDVLIDRRQARPSKGFRKHVRRLKAAKRHTA